MSSPPEFHLFVLGSFTRINSRVSGQTGRRIGSHQWSVPPWLACGLGLLLITGSMWYSCMERLFMWKWNPWQKTPIWKASSYCGSVADRWCLWPLICKNVLFVIQLVRYFKQFFQTNSFLQWKWSTHALKYCRMRICDVWEFWSILQWQVVDASAHACHL